VSPEIFLHTLAGWSGPLAVVLFASFTLGLLARFHWAFDLFCNFTLQYAAGGLILGMLLLYGGNIPFALLCLAIGNAAVFQIRNAFPPVPIKAEGPNSLTIAHFNRLYLNKNDDAMMSWLRDNANIFDAVSLHEVTPETFQKLETIRDIYPYRFPETPREDMFVCLLSRHPILESAIVTAKADFPTQPGLRIKIGTPAGSLAIYGIHAESPLDYNLQRQRNAELLAMAEVIATDTTPNIIFLGDWNITPFSPHFKNMLHTSGLANYYSSRFPLVTWPSRFLLPVLKIPIDHILFSKNMELVEKKTGASMGSDHHALVATFIVP
jgi:endonuclease/exonuclease/phosphatase (EEP) superfamily protein YafD